MVLKSIYAKCPTISEKLHFHHGIRVAGHCCMVINLQILYFLLILKTDHQFITSV